MRYRQAHRIVLVAFLTLASAWPAVTLAHHEGALAVVGYQVTDRAVLVVVHNPARAAAQGVVSLVLRLDGRSHVVAAAVVVPAGGTIPVALAIPSELAGSRLKIDAFIATEGPARDQDGEDKSDEDEGAPGEPGGNSHADGNQITEGPDTVGG